jgi:hypothetical protein
MRSGGNFQILYIYTCENCTSTTKTVTKKEVAKRKIICKDIEVPLCLSWPTAGHGVTTLGLWAKRRAGTLETQTCIIQRNSYFIPRPRNKYRLAAMSLTGADIKRTPVSGCGLQDCSFESTGISTSPRYSYQNGSLQGKRPPNHVIRHDAIKM